ncbi:hypothetical protein QQF64_025802 [Cirrhinus molitorella]|uniref:Uncharacterized protein n=1 Tax=Cirrhinus molitorella TaxID=172907 RepID=A0ABR3NQD6_9TELE
MWAAAGGTEVIVKFFKSAKLNHQETNQTAPIWHTLSTAIFGKNSQNNRQWLYVVWRYNRRDVRAIVQKDADDVPPLNDLSIQREADDMPPLSDLSVQIVADVPPNSDLSVQTEADDVPPQSDRSIQSEADDVPLPSHLSVQTEADDVPPQSDRSIQSEADDVPPPSDLSVQTEADDVPPQSERSIQSEADDVPPPSDLSVQTEADDVPPQSDRSIQSEADDVPPPSDLSVQTEADDVPPQSERSIQSEADDVPPPSDLCVKHTKDDFRTISNPPPIIFKFLIEPKIWNKISPLKGTNKLRRPWTHHMYHKFRKITPCCPLRFTYQHVRVTGSRKRHCPYIKVRANCIFSSCGATYKFTIKRKPLKHQYVTVTVCRSGEILHSKSHQRFRQASNIRREL